MGGKSAGGGDGGAAAREDARQKRITALKSEIRGQFDTPEREKRFVDIENRTREFFTPNFKQDVSDAQRELKFALARRGTFGGSAQIDAEGRLQDKIQLGERDIGQKVIGARNEAERLDQALLNNLLDQANSDGDRASIISGIPSAQIANAESALGAITRNQLENQFANVGTLFKDISDTRAFNQGTQDGAKLAALLGKNSNPFINASSGSSKGSNTSAG